MRQFYQERQQKSMLSWQTRILATMIAGGYMVDPKKGNPALEMAMKLAIDDLDSALLEDMTERQKAIPKVNSYEKVAQVFGGKFVLGPEGGGDSG